MRARPSRGTPGAGRLLSRAGRVAAVLVLAGACAPDDGDPHELAPAGEELTDHLRRVAAGAPIVIVGRVSSIEPGRVAGPDRLQLQDVRLEVEERLKGDAAISNVLLEQVASDGRTVLGFEPYHMDGRYLLFLRPSQTEAGRQVVLPGGRFELAEGRARALHPDPVMEGTSWAEHDLLKAARELAE